MKSPFHSPNTTTLIARDTEVTGDIRFTGTLEVEGRINGSILADDDSNAEVRIRENGEVTGEISVPSVIINGLVEGDVYSSRHLELAAKARVNGNVYYNLVEMVMGAEVNGSLQHRGAVQAPPRLGVDTAEQLKADEATIILD